MSYTRAELESALYDAASRYGIDYNVAHSQIQRESNFNPNAVSPAGARGIAQFMPDTARRFGLSNPFDPIASFEAWAKYMRSNLDLFGGRYDLALAGYNSGENRNEYKAAAREGRAINWAVLPAGVQRETRPYVIAILGSDAPFTGAATVETPMNGYAPAPAPVDQTESGIPTWAWLTLAAIGIVVIAR